MTVYYLMTAAFCLWSFIIGFSASQFMNWYNRREYRSGYQPRHSAHADIIAPMSPAPEPVSPARTDDELAHDDVVDYWTQFETVPVAPLDPMAIPVIPPPTREFPLPWDNVDDWATGDDGYPYRVRPYITALAS